MNIEDKDYGYEDFMESLQELYDKETFSIGVFDDFPEQVLKAAVHEFGSSDGNIPARRWLSSWYDEYRDELKELYLEAYEEWLTSDQDKEDVLREYSQEARNLVIEYLSENPLSPPLSKAWEAQKDGPHQMYDQGDMIEALQVRFSDRGQGGSDGDPLTDTGQSPGGQGGTSGAGPQGANSGPSSTPYPSPGRRNLGGRPRGVGFLRHAKNLFQALSGPQLYEGYGFRKRPDPKPHQPRSRPHPRGVDRLPVRRGTQGGRYPSINRPH